MASWWSRTPPEAHPPRRFEALVLPHLDAGYNLARWLLRNDAQAEDAVQEAALRALRYLGSLRGDDARLWFLGIVRNTCYTQLGRPNLEHGGWDEEALESLLDVHEPQPDEPSRRLDQATTRSRVDAALRGLPPALREVIVLRELQELDYGQIAQVTGVPMGTVMSRISRARERLRTALAGLGAHR
jgi:RNA polymerase sigma-70 factor (ECF subfamily)